MNKDDLWMALMGLLLCAILLGAPAVNAQSDHIGCVNFECGRTPEPGTIPPTSEPIVYKLYIPIWCSNGE
jgi:hypothetical protein